MPNIHRTASRVVLPLAAALAAAPGASAAPDASTPTQAALDAPLAQGGPSPAPALPRLPESGRMVRVLDRQLTVSPDQTVQIRGRSTTVPVRVQLRAGRYGRLVARADVPGGNARFTLKGRVTRTDRLWLRVTRTDGGPERSWVAIGAVRAMRPALASWYGPGLYGNRTACGQTLTTGLRGVAHKSLPCGTRVSIRYRGRSTTAVVIDRGPYSGAREFDLTGATARALGFSAVGRVWVQHR